MNKRVLLLLLLAGCTAMQSGLNEPVTLQLGETRTVGPDGFEITLRSVSDASGCFSAGECATKLFQGSVGVRLGDKSAIMEIDAGLSPGNAVLLDLDGYEFYLTDFHRHNSKNGEATFLVTGRVPAGTISR